MCGIVYINRHDGKPAAKAVQKRYISQKARGSDGFGYVAIQNNEVVSVQRAQTEHEIMQKLRKETASEILFHHRFPTSTPNVEEAAHPIHVSHPSFKHHYLIVHNGVIMNSLTRRGEHVKQGFKYTTELKEAYVSSKTGKVYHRDFSKFNDSEALAIDTALAVEGQTRTIPSEGAAAVIGLAVEGTTVVDRFFYRNSGNPLYYEKNKTMTTLMSTGTGQQVPAVHVMRFNESGDMEAHPKTVYVPFEYRYNVGNSYSHNYEDDYGYNTGFVRPAQNIKTLLPPKEPIIKFEDDELPANEFDPEKLNKTVRAMREEVLWDEYNSVTNVLIGLNSVAEVTDAAIDSAKDMGEAIRRRSNLQTRIDKNKAYQELLEDELTARTAFGRKINSLI